MTEQSQAQDTRDLAYLAQLYVNTVRCLGGRIIAQGYVCTHCDSMEPSDLCHNKKLRTSEVEIQDFTDSKTRAKIRKYNLVE